MVGSTPKNASEMNLQAKLCARTGLRCILGGPPQLNGDPCHGSAGNVDPQALPPPSSSVWGYYLRDEPQRQTFPSLKAQQDRIHAAHPRSLVFVNMDPPGGWFGQGSATPAAEAEYSQYLDEVKPDLLSFDCYPSFGGRRPRDLAVTPDTRAAYLAVLAIARRQAARAAIPWWTYFNIAYFNINDEPTEAQAAWQAFVSLAYGAKGLLYFYYKNPEKPCTRDFLIAPGILEQNSVEDT